MPTPTPSPDSLSTGAALWAGRWAWRLARLPLLLYVVIAAVFATFQARLIFPGAATQGDPSSRFEPGPDAELVTLGTARGDRVVALFGPATSSDGRPLPDASHRPTLLYFYGNAMRLRDVAELDFDRLRRLGANVMIAEYVGYGLSGGRAGELGCRETADAAFEHLAQRPGVDPSKIVAIGRSLGGAVAIDLAARRPVAGLVALCTFSRMLDMARLNFPYLPARWLLRHPFDSLSKIARVACPILLIHGRLDQIVPFAMSDRLAEAARAPVTRLAVDRAGHNDLFERAEGPILDALRRFLEPLTPR